MQKEALEFIALQSQQAAKVETSSIPARIIHKDFKVESLEKFEKNRSRYRGKFDTTLIAEFAAYTGKFPGGRVFVDADKMAATSFFDLGTVSEPLHAEHTAVVTLKKTAPFLSLLHKQNEPLTQKQLAEWLEDWSEVVIGYIGDGDTIDIKRVIATVRKLTIAAATESVHTQNDFNASRSSLESIEAKSTESIPAGVRFKCIPYHGLDERNIDVRLSIITSHEAPRFVLRIVRQEDLVEQLANEFTDKLKAAVKSGGEDVDITIGTFNAQ